ADLDIRRNGSHGRSSDGRIRIQAPKLVEMPLRGPDRIEPVFIGKFRTIQQQSIAVLAIVSFIACEIKQAESDLLRVSPGASTLRRIGGAVLVGMYDDRKPSRQGPKQLEHGNIERNARDREPYSWLAADPLVHAGEKVHDVSVCNHHTFRPARRTRRVDHICKICSST